MSGPANLLGTWSRHWQVFRAALSFERERDVHAKRYSETEFLPAALEVMETPPSPLGRVLLLALCAFVVIAVLWSILGKVDVVAVGQGKIIPEAQVKVIQWGGTGGGSDGLTGVVRAIHVVEGQEVRKGQLLLELDPTMAGADAAQATRGLMSAELDRARARAISGYLQNGRIRSNAPKDTPSDVARTQNQLIRSTIAEYEAKVATLREQRAEKSAEANAAQEERAKIEQTLPLLQQQVDARAELAEKGYGSKLLLWQAQEQLVERQKNLAIQAANIARSKAAISTIDMQLAQARQELTRGTLTDLAKAQDDASLRTQEITKATQRSALTRISAPVDGTITQLSQHTLGGVIQAAQPLMVIVPKDAKLIVEAQLQNKDIGFVRQGQAVHVKLEAFPFTDYGIIDGTLEQISADAVAQEQSSSGKTSNSKAAENGAMPGGLVYTARIALSPKSITQLLGKAGCTSTAPCLRKIIPGMAATAEIKTGERRIIRYLLSPIAKTASEAGRER
jgi:hemolysin D